MSYNAMKGKYHRQLMRLFIDGHKMTVTKAAEIIGGHRQHVDNLVKAMHEAGLLYVYGYEPAGLTKGRIWALRDRNQEDEPRPPRMPNKQRSERYRVNQKALSGTVRLGVWGL